MTLRRAAAARWAVVAALVLGVVLVPMAVRARPAEESDISAADLLGRVQASASKSWSGYVDTFGSVQLPVSDNDFGDLSALLGEHTRMRAWWRSENDWRVDRLTSVGETDLYHRGYGTDGIPVTVEWNYERARALVDQDPEIRLPRSSDLVPPVLGRLVATGVDAHDVRRLDSRRIAGRSAAGLRISPSAPQASIDHVDLWADPDSGVPLRLEVYDVPPTDGGDNGADPVFTSGFRAFSDERPDDSVTRFDPPAGTEVKRDGTLDVADAANLYAPYIAPPRFGGLRKAEVADRAVGVYGEGITAVVAIPLRGRDARPLRDQLRKAPGAKTVDEGILVRVGPLGVMLTGGDGSGYLVAGTVTDRTLLAGAVDLRERTRRTYFGFVD